MKALKKKGVSPFLFPVSNQGLAHSFAEIFCWKKLLEKEIAFFFDISFTWSGITGVCSTHASFTPPHNFN